MLPKHVSVTLLDRTHELSTAVGFVTGVRGETSRTGQPIESDESEVTFINLETGDRTIRVISNEALAITGC